jgi:hypothetical protein
MRGEDPPQKENTMTTTAQAARDPLHFGGAARVKSMRGRGWFTEDQIKKTLDEVDGPGGYARAIASMAPTPKPAPKPAPSAAAAVRPAVSAKPAAPIVPETAIGRDIIAPLRAIGCSSDYIAAAVEFGITLRDARAMAVAKNADAMIQAADSIGLSRTQVAAMAQAKGIQIRHRDMAFLREVPRSRDPGRAWDANTTEAAQRCRAFFGAHGRESFVGWATAEERAGRDWTCSAKDLHTPGGW